MKIAILISGRAARYEVCLLPILQNIHYDIDLFISINDTISPYYDEMKKNLEPWLKGVFIEPYQIPDDFEHTIVPNTYNAQYQYVNNKWVPRNQLSMYFNDNKAFTMACKYADDHNFEYDVYMRFRADICNLAKFPEITKPDINKLNLYSIMPLCMFTSFGKHKRDIISSDWVWGNRKTMNIYCNTYTYVLLQNRNMNGNYLFHFESNHTDCIVDNNVSIEYVNVIYNVDANRRIFETWWTTEQGDSRKYLPNGALNPIQMADIIDTSHIPIIPS